MKRDGDTATIEVYASRGMTLPALDDSQREETLWGMLELEFRNCGEMELRWEADRPGFDDGEATLQRLTFNEGLEC